MSGSGGGGGDGGRRLGCAKAAWTPAVAVHAIRVALSESRHPSALRVALSESRSPGYSISCRSKPAVAAAGGGGTVAAGVGGGGGGYGGGGGRVGLSPAP